MGYGEKFGWLVKNILMHIVEESLSILNVSRMEIKETGKELMTS